jgi:membrane protein implicated in regulation of membrane protease activity
MVRIHGELWRAKAKDEVPKDAAVRVVGVDGLTLNVEAKKTSETMAS